ncbi:hypothetical protein PRIPAC_86933, partial [Pristionchus pacificus]|uniref:Rpl-26 n=1 Tax=Pristionchus pacificus TaxID=54126 RepID=A0A2A6BMF3_PRIPA
MKQNSFVSSDRGKAHKRHFTAPSHIKRKMMSAPLTRELCGEHGIRAIPIRMDDEATSLGNSGRLMRVYRKKFVVHIDKIIREKSNGSTVHIGIHPSNVAITKLKLDNDRKKIIERKSAGRAKVLGVLKGKHSDSRSRWSPPVLLLCWLFGSNKSILTE